MVERAADPQVSLFDVLRDQWLDVGLAGGEYFVRFDGVVRCFCVGGRLWPGAGLVCVGLAQPCRPLGFLVTRQRLPLFCNRRFDGIQAERFLCLGGVAVAPFGQPILGGLIDDNDFRGGFGGFGSFWVRGFGVRFDRSRCVDPLRRLCLPRLKPGLVVHRGNPQAHPDLAHKIKVVAPGVFGFCFD